MSTLKELFDKYGSVWLAHRHDKSDKHFKPLAYSEEDTNFIIGETTKFTCNAIAIKEDSEGFILYEAPKPKVKRYQYKLIPASECYFPKITVEFFKDDIDLFRYYDSQAFDKFERLDSTMQEFDW